MGFKGNPFPTLTFGLGVYGDGSDGDVTLDGVAAVPWATLAANVYTVTRDVHPNNLTINAGVTLKPNGWPVQVLGTLTNAGTITAAGAAGPAGAGGARGTAGSSNGGGVAGTNNVGGKGGTSNVNQGGLLAPVEPVNYLPQAINLAAFVATGYVQGNGGTGGGGTSPGGGGGGGGGVMMLAASKLTNSGTITVAGGAATNGGASPGGGGGGGGWLMLIYGLLTNTGTITVAGGAGGTGTPAGGAGGAGRRMDINTASTTSADPVTGGRLTTIRVR